MLADLDPQQTKGKMGTYWGAKYDEA